MTSEWKLKEGELVFQFIGAENVEKLDRQGVPKPNGMKLVDFVVEEKSRTLLIEVKDPSHSSSPAAERKKYVRKLRSDEIICGELVPKARGSYTYLHLMKRDSNPFYFVVLFGLDRLPEEKALLLGFKDRLMKRIQNEAAEPWKRIYIQDCAVVTTDDWEKYFKNYTLLRETD